MITICMIVKNEEGNLEKCLNAINDYNFEFVIVDTGSSDNTKMVAKKYTDYVYDYKWNDNFSDARNYAISKIKTEYVLILDADEVLTYIDYDKLIKCIENNKDKVGRIERDNEFVREGKQYVSKERVNRLFSKDKYKYEGSIHEQIVSINGSKYETYNLPIKFSHSGYSNEEIDRKDKIKRNIEMLLLELEENPNDPYLLYQLGKSYYMEKSYQEAEKYFVKCLDYDLDTKLEYVQDLVESYGYTLIENKKYTKALELTNIYDEFKNSADFVFMIGLVYMNNGMFDKAILEFQKSLKYKECKMKGVNSFLANYNIGVINECLGNKEVAINYYKKCNNYKMAMNRLSSLKILKFKE